MDFQKIDQLQKENFQNPTSRRLVATTQIEYEKGLFSTLILIGYAQGIQSMKINHDTLVRKETEIDKFQKQKLDKEKIEKEKISLMPIQKLQNNAIFQFHDLIALDTVKSRSGTYFLGIFNHCQDQSMEIIEFKYDGSQNGRRKIEFIPSKDEDIRKPEYNITKETESVQSQRKIDVEFLEPTRRKNEYEGTEGSQRRKIELDALRGDDLFAFRILHIKMDLDILAFIFSNGIVYFYYYDYNFFEEESVKFKDSYFLRIFKFEEPIVDLDCTSDANFIYFAFSQQSGKIHLQTFGKLTKKIQKKYSDNNLEEEGNNSFNSPDQTNSERNQKQSIDIKPNFSQSFQHKNLDTNIHQLFKDQILHMKDFVDLGITASYCRFARNSQEKYRQTTNLDLVGIEEIQISQKDEQKQKKLKFGFSEEKNSNNTQLEISLLVSTLDGEFIRYKNISQQLLNDEEYIRVIKAKNSGITGFSLKHTHDEVLISYFSGSIVFYKFNEATNQWDFVFHHQTLHSNYFSIDFIFNQHSELIELVTDDELFIFEQTFSQIN